MAEYCESNNKICIKCGVEKTLNEFYKRKISKDGYRNSCKICCDIHKTNYYLNNKEHLDNKAKKWRISNLQKLKENKKQFLLNNPTYAKDYYQMNKDKINKRNKNRRSVDINYKTKENIRMLIKNSFRNKGINTNSRTYEILGCTIPEFRLYLESKFEPWMNWENKGLYDGTQEFGWDVDHIIPLSTAKTEVDLIRLNHYTNLQPLCGYYNRHVKKDKNE